MLEKLNRLNDVEIKSVLSDDFKTYGRIIKGYDFTQMLDYMENHTDIPESGNCYFPSIADMESTDVFKKLQTIFYGGMPIQAGYCNGRNSTYNGFEYHKGSEINVAVTDFMLVLGHSYDVCDNTYKVSQAEVFFVPKGTAIEMYQTTLHLSPCKVSDEGFKDIVILPRGTNTPLVKKEISDDKESELLLQTNKWVIAHPDREPLIKQGAVAGLIGENKELFYK